VLVLGVLVAYPIVALAGGPVWVVASAGACAALALAAWHGVGGTRALVRDGVSWEILLFLGLVSVIGVGLRNAGIVHRLTIVYEHGGVVGIGAVSAVGSALVNNHPMSIINMLALREVPGAGIRATLAALIGGDLGPRFLPLGSLAGLLWLEALRRAKIDVSPVRFILIGAAVTIPTLTVSLGLLYAIT
jgi:arsenical pump membrane protein